MSLPKGILVAIGGAEDKGANEEMEQINRDDFFKQGILNHMVGLAAKKAPPRIEVVTTASSIPEEVGPTYKRAFRKLGCTEVGHLKITRRDEADTVKVIW